MLKFFACYIWLILGFLTSFIILFSSEKIFESFPVPLITMMVWMTGEMDFDILHPKTRNIRLVKERGWDEKDPHNPRYVGISHNSDDYLQFEGNLSSFNQKFNHWSSPLRHCPPVLCCICPAVLHSDHEPPDWSGGQRHWSPDGDRQAGVHHLPDQHDQRDV